MRLFAELNREELRAAAPECLLVMPLGATEQHGPHLATGTDFFTIDAIAREASRLLELPVIVTPALPFGSSDHHLIFGGTISLSTETYYRVLRELLESLVADGFRQIFLLNGHGGNHELAQLAARDVARIHPVKVAAGSYWTIAWDALVEAGAHRGRRLPGHAGDFETSMMLSLRPDLIPGKLPHRDTPGDTDPRGFGGAWRTERHGSWKEIDGYSDSPDQANAGNGGSFRAVIVTQVARAFEAFYNG
ncbi:MAG TPA: creatininase family protein [Bryobacteraceae bacterium]|nr:creatininase family protein [Bryobacteraceae bacterium]